MDKLSAMATFAKVVETGSFTRAAEVLAIPKASVSQRVSDLERVLGAQLLHRTTRNLRLTDDGQSYFAKVQGILQEIEELEQALRRRVIEPRGRLRVEALTSIARWVLAPRLADFQAHFPHVSLRLGASDRITNLFEEGVDCAIRGGPLEDSSLIARHVCDVHLGLYASPRYLETSAPVACPDDLQHHRRLSWFGGKRHPFSWTLTSSAQHYDLPAVEGLLFDDPDVAITSCIAGAGICPGAPFAVAHWVQTGLLKPVLPDWHFVARPIHIIYPSRQHLSARVRCFVDWVIEQTASAKILGTTPRQLAQQKI
jgi:LysR family transcriptional regulator for bpeEF and oprC